MTVSSLYFPAIIIWLISSRLNCFQSDICSQKQIISSVKQSQACHERAVEMTLTEGAGRDSCQVTVPSERLKLCTRLAFRITSSTVTYL